jgi:hypothetical protein
VLLSVEHMQEDHKFYRLLVRVHPFLVCVFSVRRAVCVRCVRVRVRVMCACAVPMIGRSYESATYVAVHRKMTWT